ncbi:hypothetical protein GCM10010922_01450 [Microbacterium sorbitolivorans]|uniref:M23 family peptidase n=1 Tax=Microbacterium sorbitolivorans TaxID=1867410 RepID=A0A367Y752_9MICO|nr:M23 family metallopeptidase [Microbacterium sorbitolivorans]RCK61668.1 M23 family peptidase [Microbacterium sorbitolivorans]GGF30211.1 hypothetical protein GCM10010922_01450 [Microbacterium sorbitolivorans]
MALTDAPEIRIDGEAVSSSWRDTGRIGLEGIKITWGRSSHIDRANPAQLYCEIIDPRAHLNGYQALTGKPIEVWRAGDDVSPARRIFNGRVDDYDVEIRWISDPHTFTRRRVWVLSIQASDKLAELAKAVLPGPGVVDLVVQAAGPAYWGYLERLAVDGFVRPARHVVAMMEQGADQIVDAIDWNDPYDGMEMVTRLIPWGEGKSILDLIEGTYAIHPLGYPIYEPSSNAVLLGKPAVGPAVKLAYESNVINMRVGTAGYAIPASKIVVPDGYKAATGADESIDIVQVTQTAFTLGDDTDGGLFSAEYKTVTEHAVDGYDGSLVGRREHRIEVDLLAAYEDPANPDPDPETPGGDYEWPFSLDYVTSDYGWRTAPYEGFHAGIDFSYAGIGGAAIHPVGAGTVSLILSVNDGWHGWGNGVQIDHGDGLKTVYAHMVNAPSVINGQAVEKTTVLGYVGNTGNSFGNHLHLETWLNGQHMNPHSWMDLYGHETAPAPIAGEGDIGERIASETADALAQLRGAAVMPTLRLDWRNFDYDYPITYGWLDTSCKQVPVYFPGSVFADLLDISRVHQFIGGTLVYADGGWTHDLTAAPALMARAGLTVAELVTTDPPLIGQFADDISIADLGNVHEGIH